MVERLLFDLSELAPLFRVVSFAISSFSAGRPLRCQYLLYARLPRSIAVRGLPIFAEALIAA
jgi:hypothetical protein